VVLGILRPGPAAAQADADTTSASADSLGQGTDDSLDGDIIDMGEASADTVRRGPGSEAQDLMEVLKPSYETSYNVLRQNTDWNQNFDFGATLGFLTFTNKTTFNVGSDSGRDEDKRVGANGTTLRLTMIRKLPITTKIDLGRTSLVRPGDERKTSSSAVQSSASYNLKLLGVRNTLSAGGGFTHRQDVLVGRDLQNETRDDAVSGNLQWRGNWTYKTLTVGSNFREARAKKTSVLVKPGLDTTNPSTTTNRNYGLNVTFNPKSWVNSSVSLSKTSGNDEFFLVREDALERKVNHNQSLRATVNLTPAENFTLDWSIGSTSHDLMFDVRRDIASSGDGFNWDGKLTTVILGTKVEGTLSNQRDKLNPATSANTDTRNNVFEGKLSRPLSKKLSARFNWLVRATQLFYTDPNPDRILDRDELRTKLQPSLTYTPSEKWQVTASYIRSTSRRVELNPTRALQTQENEDFSVDFDINYRLSKRTSIGQTYSIQAAYSTFDFSRRSDDLLSTQRIGTTLNTQLTPRVSLSLGHQFTLQDSGPFRFEPDGTRVFTRNLRKYRQELTTTVRYVVASWLTLTADSRFLRTDDVFEASGLRNINRDLSLRQGVDIKHNLGLGAKLTASAEFVRSSSQESYWHISSTLSKEF
jgi:hypothetical protein